MQFQNVYIFCGQDRFQNLLWVRSDLDAVEKVDKHIDKLLKMNPDLCIPWYINVEGSKFYKIKFKGRMVPYIQKLIKGKSYKILCTCNSWTFRDTGAKGLSMYAIRIKPYATTHDQLKEDNPFDKEDKNPELNIDKNFLFISD